MDHDMTSLDRRQAVSQVLQPALSPEQHTRALRLYDQEFSEAERMSLNDLCKRLHATLPDVELSHETRLDLLKALRRPVQAQEDARDQVSTITRSVKTSVPRERVESPPQSGDENAVGVQDMVTQYLERYTKLARPPRKSLRLKGWFEQIDDGQYQGAMVVKNLSRMGAALRLFAPHTLKVDQDVLLKFALDDFAQTEIQAMANVRHMTGDIMGVRFATPEALPQALVDYVEA